MERCRKRSGDTRRKLPPPAAAAAAAKVVEITKFGRNEPSLRYRTQSSTSTKIFVTSNWTIQRGLHPVQIIQTNPDFSRLRLDGNSVSCSKSNQTATTPMRRVEGTANDILSEMSKPRQKLVSVETLRICDVTQVNNHNFRTVSQAVVTRPEQALHGRYFTAKKKWLASTTCFSTIAMKRRIYGGIFEDWSFSSPPQNATKKPTNLMPRRCRTLAR